MPNNIGPWNDQEANEILIDVQAQLKSDELIEPDTVLRLSKVSSGHLAPLTTIFGGIIAHEIIKCVTHKGTPIDQFMFYDAAKCLPPSISEGDLPLVSRQNSYSNTPLIYIICRLD
jgi:hypothetical protein